MTTHCRLKSIAIPVFVGMLHIASGTAEAAPHIFSQSSEIAQILASIPENSWVQLNANKFSDTWTPLAQRPTPPGVPTSGSPRAIILAWSSFAWDSNRGNLLIFGGGHANYPGNEVHLWNAKTLFWERASLPSDVMRTDPNSKGEFTAIDGIFNAPIASHTYDNSEFLPRIDRFVTFGGASFNTGAIWTRPNWLINPDGTYSKILDSNGNQIPKIITGPYFWDPSRADPTMVGGTTGSQVKPGQFPNILGGNMWENRDNLDPKLGPRPGRSWPRFVNGTTAYAEENGNDVLFIQTGSDLFKYMVPDLNYPLSDTYELVGIVYTPFSGYGAGAYSKDQKLYVRIAAYGTNGYFTYWDLNNAGPKNRNVMFTPTIVGGTLDLTKLYRYGLEYDPLRHRFLMWGGNELWELKPPATLPGQWTLTLVLNTVLDGPNALDASNPNLKGFNGILGKWKYAPTLDVFFGLFDPIDGTIWAYKPDNWSPTLCNDLVANPGTCVGDGG